MAFRRRVRFFRSQPVAVTLVAVGGWGEVFILLLGAWLLLCAALRAARERRAGSRGRAPAPIVGEGARSAHCGRTTRLPFTRAQILNPTTATNVTSAGDYPSFSAKPQGSPQPSTRSNHPNSDKAALGLRPTVG